MTSKPVGNLSQQLHGFRVFTGNRCHNLFAGQGVHIRNLQTASPTLDPAWRYLGLRALAFAVIFGVLQLTWQSLHGSAVEYIVVHDGTVRPAAFLVNLFTPDVHARAIEFSVRAPGGGLNILNGCEGLEALFLLCAAFVVAPMAWRAKALGFLIGIVVVFVVNQARILLLFYAYRMDRGLFDPLHATVAPIGVILLVSAYFYVWLSWARQREQSTHAQPA